MIKRHEEISGAEGWKYAVEDAAADVLVGEVDLERLWRVLDRSLQAHLEAPQRLFTLREGGEVKERLTSEGDRPFGFV